MASHPCETTKPPPAPPSQDPNISNQPCHPQGPEDEFDGGFPFAEGKSRMRGGESMRTVFNGQNTEVTLRWKDGVLEILEPGSSTRVGVSLCALLRLAELTAASSQRCAKDKDLLYVSFPDGTAQLLDLRPVWNPSTVKPQDRVKFVDALCEKYPNNYAQFISLIEHMLELCQCGAYGLEGQQLVDQRLALHELRGREFKRWLDTEITAQLKKNADQKKRIAGLQNENVALQNENVALQNENVALRNENVALKYRAMQRDENLFGSAERIQALSGANTGPSQTRSSVQPPPGGPSPPAPQPARTVDDVPPKGPWGPKAVPCKADICNTFFSSVLPRCFDQSLTTVELFRIELKAVSLAGLCSNYALWEQGTCIPKASGKVNGNRQKFHIMNTSPGELRGRFLDSRSREWVDFWEKPAPWTSLWGTSDTATLVPSVDRE
eukprot:TRINITY_DN25859_c0_g1_i10.p1 TRINITY_DN25859_c0_g1~~TRINITY_DN25859_c0_g1_i10.p1  ORF type:complete len:438 (-),score=70.30 TRINITY_DN25859_c0_g1_i10:696-2009(-)